MEENDIKAGDEIIFDGCRWGYVEEVHEDGLLVTDQDGGDHDLDFGRVTDHTKKS